MTKLASIVMLPIKNLSTLRQIEFLPLSENRVLVILVLNSHEVQNRIIYTDRNYTASELQQVSNFITANFAGKNLDKIRANLVETMQSDRQNIESLTQAIIDMANKAFSDQASNDYVMSGENNLLGMTQESELDKLRNLFEIFASKRNILHLLDQCLKADEIKIYIGEESGYASLGDYSLVTTPYKKAGKIVGVLGVIGPTRMHYDRAIAAVDVTAKLLSAALEEIK
jgi:heat-inducible transcriptional repressor